MTKKKKRNRSFTLSASEVMTIMVLFHLSGYKDIKHFYIFYVTALFTISSGLHYMHFWFKMMGEERTSAED